MQDDRLGIERRATTSNLHLAILKVLYPVLKLMLARVYFPFVADVNRDPPPPLARLFAISGIDLNKIEADNFKSDAAISTAPRRRLYSDDVIGAQSSPRATLQTNAIYYGGRKCYFGLEKNLKSS